MTKISLLFLDPTSSTNTFLISLDFILGRHTGIVNTFPKPTLTHWKTIRMKSWESVENPSLFTVRYTGFNKATLESSAHYTLHKCQPYPQSKISPAKMKSYVSQENLPECLGYHGLQGSVEGGELLYISRSSFIAAEDRLQGHPMLLHKTAEGWAAKGLHKGTGTIGPRPSPYPGWP